MAGALNYTRLPPCEDSVTSPVHRAFNEYSCPPTWNGWHKHNSLSQTLPACPLNFRFVLLKQKSWMCPLTFCRTTLFSQDNQEDAVLMVTSSLYQSATTENLYSRHMNFFSWGDITLAIKPWDTFMSYASWWQCEHSLKANASTFNHSVAKRGRLVCPKGPCSSEYGNMDCGQARTGLQGFGQQSCSVASLPPSQT